jgi:hypothetical protein
MRRNKVVQVGSWQWPPHWWYYLVALWVIVPACKRPEGLATPSTVWRASLRVWSENSRCCLSQLALCVVLLWVPYAFPTQCIQSVDWLAHRVHCPRYSISINSYPWL